MFDILAAKAGSGATVSIHDAEVWVVVTAPPWSYAMIVQRCPQISELIGPAIISFEASCPRGRMQYGLLAKDMTTILDARTLEVEDRFARMELFAPVGEEAAAIVVRPEIEVECEARLRAIEARHLPSSFEAPSFRDVMPMSLRPVPQWNQYYGYRADDLDQRMRAQAFAILESPIAMPWLDSLQVMIYPGYEMCRAVAVSGVYEPALLLALRRLLRPGSIFLDAGANMGLMSLFAARQVGPNGLVLAFEPSPRDAARLDENIALNRLSKNICVARLALGNATGQLALRIAEPQHSGQNTAGARFAYEGVQQVDVVTVPMTTIDKYLERIGTPHRRYEAGRRRDGSSRPRRRPACVAEASARFAFRGVRQSTGCLRFDGAGIGKVTNIRGLRFLRAQRRWNSNSPACFSRKHDNGNAIGGSRAKCVMRLCHVVGTCYNVRRLHGVGR